MEPNNELRAVRPGEEAPLGGEAVSPEEAQAAQEGAEKRQLGRRIIWATVLGGGAVFSLLILALILGDDASGSAEIGRSSVQSSTVFEPPGGANMTPRAREIAEQADIMESRMAQLEGRSHVGVPIPQPVEQAPEPSPVSVMEPIHQDVRPAEAATQRSSEALQQQAQAMGAYVDKVVSGRFGYRGGIQNIGVAAGKAGVTAESGMSPTGVSAVTGGAVPAAATGQEAPPQTASSRGPRMARPHKAYGNMAITATTDAPAAVIVEVLSGPFRNGILYGSFTRGQDSIPMRFDRLDFNGRDYAVDAIAIDPETQTPAVATNVDNHTFQRIILPAAAEFVRGIGDLLAEPRTTVIIDGVTQVQSSPEVRLRDILGAGAGAAGGAASSILQAEAGKIQQTVEYEVNQPIGIFFLKAVHEGDAQ